MARGRRILSPVIVGNPTPSFLLVPVFPGCHQQAGGRPYRENQFLCMCTSFSKNNTISAAFKVLVPIFLFWRYSTAFLPFHFHPHAPGRDIKVWHALGHAFCFQTPCYAWRPCAAVGNGKDSDAGISLLEPSDKLSLLFVLCWDSVHSRVSTR